MQSHNSRHARARRMRGSPRAWRTSVVVTSICLRRSQIRIQLVRHADRISSRLKSCVSVRRKMGGKRTEREVKRRWQKQLAYEYVNFSNTTNSISSLTNNLNRFFPSPDFSLSFFIDHNLLGLDMRSAGFDLLTSRAWTTLRQQRYWYLCCPLSPITQENHVRSWSPRCPRSRAPR